MVNFPFCLGPRNCKELLAKGRTLSGWYAIYPGVADDSITVFCDMDTDGGGWTVSERECGGDEGVIENTFDFNQRCEDCHLLTAVNLS